jgi:hypothetical protein
MPKNFNVFRQMALGYILIVGLSIGLITPIVQAEAPTDTLYTIPSKTAPVLVDGMTQAERAAKIDAFFTDRGNLPLAGYGLAFVKAADNYNIDWRLAAAIAYNESTAGAQECRGKNGEKTYNAFGYRGCNSKFTSYEHAIDTVTRNLAGEIDSTKHYYANKSVEEKIDAYNPPQYNKNYKRLVLWTMNKISITDTNSIASKATVGAKELAIK